MVVLSSTLLALGVAASAEHEEHAHHNHSRASLHAADHGRFAEHEDMMPTHWRNLVGLKLIGLAAVPHDEAEAFEAQWGIGVIYERTLIEGWLEVELSGNLVLASDGPHAPLDVLLKKPFHVSHIVDPYVGIGPSLTIGLGAERFAAPGGLVTGGLYIWVRERLGIMAELDYGVVYELSEWVHELEATTGAVARF